MAISPLPTPPSRDDPANFAARGDAFLGALPDFATELNDALPTINEAIPASEIAVALVNYKGDYNSATTYLVGQSVTYEGDRYLSKKTNLNITPVNGDDWYALQATSETVFESILNQSSAITLTAAQSGYLLVSGTQSINLNLPDATSLTGRTYVIKNVGSFVMFVYDASGNYLFPLSPSVCIEIWASDVSTVAGQWASQTLPPDYFSITTSLFSSAAPLTFYQGFAKISTSQQICAYYRNTQSGYKVYTTIISQSSGTPSFNTSYELSDVGSLSAPAITMCSATTGVLTWHNASLGYRGCVVTVSGTTITYGTIVTITPDTTFYGYAKVTNLSATTAFTSYMVASTTILGNVLTISGTTLSVGTQGTIASTSGYDYFLGAGSATFAGVVRTSSNNLYARGITISGTTFTVGTDTNILSSNGDNDVTGCVCTSNKFALFHYDGVNSAMVVRTVTWSGTTPTANTAQNIYTSGSYSKMIGCYSSTSGVVAYNKGGGQMYFKGWTLSGNTFTLGTEVSGVSTFTNTFQYNSLLGFSAPDVGTPTSATYMSHYQYYNGMNIQTLTISGTTITANASKYVVPSADYIDISYSPKTICSLSTTRAILISSGFSDVGSIVLNASLISYANEVPVVLQSVTIGSINSNAYYSAIASLSSTQAIVTYSSPTGTMVTNVITMSGDTISVGTQAEISSTTTCTLTSVCRLSATTAICFWRNSSTSARSVILTVSGSTVSVATYAEVSVADILNPQVEALTSTKAILVYGSSGIKSNILTISGTTISVGPTNVIVAPQVTYLYLAVASSTKCVLGTGGTTASHNANLVVLTINGDVVTYAPPALIPYITQGCRIAMLGANRGVISYVSNSYAIRYFVISNNVAIFSNAITLNSTYLTPLTAPNLASPSAATVASAVYDGYQIGTNKIFSIGALN